MKQNNLITGSAVLVAVIAVMGIVGYSNAHPNDEDNQGKNFDPERHEQMEEIFENKDYEAWKTLMEESRMGSRVQEQIDSQEKFEKLAESHKLAEEGDYEASRAIKEELGLGGRKGMYGKGFKKGFRMGRGMYEGNFHRFIDEDGDGNCDFQQELEQ